jgi:hypothetical protein
MTSKGSTETRGMRAIVMLAATIFAAVIILTTVSREAEAGTRVVTKTFSNASQILVLDASVVGQSAVAEPYPSEIDVSGFRRGRIRDVNLKLKGFGHTFPDDVDVLLVGPQGQNALVMASVGGDFSVGGINLILDDEADSSLPDNGQFITSGTYQPTEGTTGLNQGLPRPANFPSQAPAGPYGADLSVFDGTNPKGMWKLFVIDDTPGDAGEFMGGWSLVIKASVRH